MFRHRRHIRSKWKKFYFFPLVLLYILFGLINTEILVVEPQQNVKNEQCNDSMCVFVLYTHQPLHRGLQQRWLVGCFRHCCLHQKQIKKNGSNFMNATTVVDWRLLSFVVRVENFDGTTTGWCNHSSIDPIKSNWPATNTINSSFG
jgi:hypothetical protein